MLKSKTELNLVWEYDNLTKEQCSACVQYLSDTYGIDSTNYGEGTYRERIIDTLHWYTIFDKETQSYSLVFHVDTDQLDDKWKSGGKPDVIWSYNAMKQMIEEGKRITEILTDICEES